MTNLDSIFKSRHYFANKGPSSQGYGFSSGHVGGCESWTVKKAERWRIDAFELWCWRRLLKVPWTTRRSNQSILKEISPGRTDAKAETPVLWPLHTKSWLIGKDPDAGSDWGQEEKGTTEVEMDGWHHWPMDMSLSELGELVMDRKAWHAACTPRDCKQDWATELNWEFISEAIWSRAIC